MSIKLKNQNIKKVQPKSNILVSPEVGRAVVALQKRGSGARKIGGALFKFFALKIE